MFLVGVLQDAVAPSQENLYAEVVDAMPDGFIRRILPQHKPQQTPKGAHARVSKTVTTFIASLLLLSRIHFQYLKIVTSLSNELCLFERLNKHPDTYGASRMNKHSASSIIHVSPRFSILFDIVFFKHSSRRFLCLLIACQIL